MLSKCVQYTDTYIQNATIQIYIDATTKWIEEKLSTI